MNMSQELGNIYGTTKQASAEPTPEDREKLAQADFFMNMCKEGGIDPKALTDAQIDKLWKVAMDAKEEADKGKSPFPPKKDEKKDEEKEAAARREYAEKRAAAEKIAEADSMGRIMAHAYVDELKKIAEAGKTAAFPPGFVPGGGKGGEEKKEEKGEKKEEKEDEKKKESQARAEALIARLSKEAGVSTTAALDEKAAYLAVDLLKSVNVDEKIAAAKINAVLTLGVPESTKIAMAQGYEAALQVRALEFCERAGFPVDWSKV